MGNTPELLGLPKPQEPQAYDRRLDSWKQLADDIWESPTRERKIATLVRHLRSVYRVRLGDRTPKKIYQNLRRSFRAAQLSLHRMLGPEMLPIELLKVVSPLPLTGDPINLMKIGFPRESRISKRDTRFDRRRFEARRAIDLGFKFFALHTLRGTDLGRGNMKWVTDYLIERGIFIGKPEPTSVLTWHDHLDNLRYVDCSVIHEIPSEPILYNGDPRFVSIPHASMYLNFFMHGNSPYPILVQWREKDRMSIVRKLTATGQSWAEQTPDLLAVRIICLKESDLNPIFESFVKKLPAGITIEIIDRRAPNAPGKNEYSALDYQDVKIIALAMNPDGDQRKIEIQLVTARVHFNVENSAGPINHRRYEARQLVGIKNPGLWQIYLPESIYGIPWKNPEIIAHIEKHIANSLLNQYKP